MKLVFVGADHEVTGSCHYLEVAGKHILVDYGMEQGVNVFENVPLPVAESMIDYVFLTHAHVDHRVFCRFCMPEASEDRSIPRMLQRICVALCCVTVHISRVPKRNGRIVRQNVLRIMQWWSRCIPWRMQMV